MNYEEPVPARKTLRRIQLRFRLIAQLPNPRDSTKDSSLVWPDNRKAIDPLPALRSRVYALAINHRRQK
jgi:hypothetical protein